MIEINMSVIVSTLWKVKHSFFVFVHQSVWEYSIKLRFFLSVKYLTHSIIHVNDVIHWNIGYQWDSASVHDVVWYSNKWRRRNTSLFLPLDVSQRLLYKLELGAQEWGSKWAHFNAHLFIYYYHHRESQTHKLTKS